jgi:hypothetical protein
MFTNNRGNANIFGGGQPNNTLTNNNMFGTNNTQPQNNVFNNNAQTQNNLFNRGTYFFIKATPPLPKPTTCLGRTKEHKATPCSITKLKATCSMLAPIPRLTISLARTPNRTTLCSISKDPLRGITFSARTRSKASTKATSRPAICSGRTTNSKELSSIKILNSQAIFSDKTLSHLWLVLVTHRTICLTLQ